MIIKYLQMGGLTIEILANGDEELEMGISFPLNEQIATTKANDTIVMENHDDYFVTTEVFDEGLRNNFVIEEACEEEEFPVEFDLPTGTYLEFSKNEYDKNKMDGSFNLEPSRKVTNW